MRSFVLATVLAGCVAGAYAGTVGVDALRSTIAQPAPASASVGFDGLVESVRQTVIAAQVPGAIVQLEVRAGDRVKAGQVLLRIDARAAEQNAAASEAQVQATRATLEMATQELERQKQLFARNYISEAALQRAESAFKATRAQSLALAAQAGAAHTESGLHVIRAPFDGVVAEVPVSLGDMAMPGRALLTLYDPAALRLTAAVPQSLAARVSAGMLPRAELPALPAGRRWVTPLRVEVLPTADPGTHTVRIRLDLPAGIEGASPGMFARLWLPAAAEGAAPAAPVVTVPIGAIVRRAELTALYVLDRDGRPVLRQVRLGRSEGGQVEILSGLSAGERVVTDPQAAARVR